MLVSTIGATLPEASLSKLPFTCNTCCGSFSVVGVTSKLPVCCGPAEMGTVDGDTDVGKTIPGGDPEILWMVSVIFMG
jgi:hypothetical protein